MPFILFHRCALLRAKVELCYHYCIVCAYAKMLYRHCLVALVVVVARHRRFIHVDGDLYSSYCENCRAD